MGSRAAHQVAAVYIEAERTTHPVDARAAARRMVPRVKRGERVVLDAQRFSRQLRLPEIGAAGQHKLGQANVLVVGCGGLGSPVIQYLAAAGVGRLTLVDDDVVEESNLNRQTLHRVADLGRPKAERAAEWVEQLAPQVNACAAIERLRVDNAREMIRAHELVMDCTDGLPVKYLLNDACVREQRPLVHGAVVAMSGQVFVVPPGGRPCLRCLFPVIPGEDEVPSCQETGVLGATCGIVGSFMASEAVKLLVGFGDPLVGRYLAIDAMGANLRTLRFGPDARCAVCSATASIDARSANDYVPHCAR